MSNGAGGGHDGSEGGWAWDNSDVGAWCSDGQGCGARAHGS